MEIKGLGYMLDYNGERSHLYWIKNNRELNTTFLSKVLRKQSPLNRKSFFSYVSSYPKVFYFIFYPSTLALRWCCINETRRLTTIVVKTFNTTNRSNHCQTIDFDIIVGSQGELWDHSYKRVWHLIFTQNFNILSLWISSFINHPTFTFSNNMRL